MEVRLRSQHATRRRRQRTIATISAIVLILASGVGIYLGANKGLTKLFFNNPDYNVTSIEIDTDGVLTRDTILELGEVHDGENIFQVKLNEVRKRLETLPQIEWAKVERQLPNRIVIQIGERKPVAWLAPEGVDRSKEAVFRSTDSFLVDANGVLLRPKKLIAENYLLPIIRGISLDRYTPGQRIENDEIKSSLNLIRAHHDSIVGAKFQVSDIDVTQGYSLVVTDNRSQLQVSFGLDDPELQLKTLDTLLAAIDQGGRRPATISLMTLESRQRNIPVTFRSDSGSTDLAKAGAPPVTRAFVANGSIATEISAPASSAPAERASKQSASTTASDAEVTSPMIKIAKAISTLKALPANARDAESPAIVKASPKTKPLKKPTAKDGSDAREPFLSQKAKPRSGKEVSKLEPFQ